MAGIRPGITVGMIRGTHPGIMAAGTRRVIMAGMAVITAAAIIITVDIIIITAVIREDITVSMHVMREVATTGLHEQGRRVRHAVIRAQEAKVQVVYQEEILYHRGQADKRLRETNQQRELPVRVQSVANQAQLQVEAELFHQLRRERG
jgi:type IV secretory pathway VirB3-like protein